MAKKAVVKEPSPITKAMRTKYAAPVSATVMGTAFAGIGAWALDTYAGVKVPADVAAWSAALISVGIWHAMPVEWEAK